MIMILLLILISPLLYSGEIVDVEIIRYVHQKALEYEVSPEIIFAIGITESNWRNVVSGYNNDGSRDIGVMQLNSKYISYYERTFWYKDIDFNPWNVKHNIEMAIMYLSHLHSYTNNWRDAVKAYNVGLRGLKKYPEYANRYIVRVSRSLANIQVYTNTYIYYD